MGYPCTMAVTGSLPFVDAAALLRDDVAFLEREVGAWSLLGRPLVESGDAWSYRTRSLEPTLVHVGSSKVLLHGDDVILPCKKRPGTSFSSVIFIGRASSNDIEIAHSSISKLHARLELKSATSAALSDAGSSNGTFVDEVRLAQDEHKDVTSGSVITFGSCTYVLVSSSVLRRLLSEPAPR